MMKIILFMAMTIAFLSAPSVHAQNFELLKSMGNPNPEFKQALTKTLEKEPKFAEFKEKFSGGIPGIDVSMVDLNFDNKQEIVVRLLHDYHFRDANNNVQTYVFAQTSKGLIKIFDAMAGDVALQGIGKSGLKNIVGFRGLTSDYDTYVWDGQKRYIKDE